MSYRLNLPLTALCLLFIFVALLNSSFATNRSQQGPQDVLVFLKSRANLQAAFLFRDRETRIKFVHRELVRVAEHSQKPLTLDLEKRGLRYKAFYIDNVILVENTSQSDREWLSQHQLVKHIADNAVSTLHLPPLDKNNLTIASAEKKLNNELGHISRIEAHRVWNELNIRGENIVVAGQDTGVFWQHNSLRRQYRGYSETRTDHNYNWHDAFNPLSAEPFDDHSHGTHTLGTAVGSDGGSNRIGVAPAAQWITCRNMKSGVGTVASYLSCFEFFLAPYPIGGDPRKDGRPDLAPHIVNNSWSCPPKEGCRGDELLGAIQAHYAAGIMNVVAAGNEGPKCSSIAQPPAMYSEGLITVGAYNRYIKDIASFSSRGPSAWSRSLAPNLVAFGDIIRSAMNTGANTYDDKAGTSMASPQIAGVVALMWSASPQLIGQIDETIEILHQTAEPLTSRESCGGISGQTVPNNTFGYGMVNAYRAVQKALKK